MLADAKGSPVVFVVDNVLACTGGAASHSLLRGRLLAQLELDGTAAGCGGAAAAPAAADSFGEDALDVLSLVNQDLTLYISYEEASPKMKRRAAAAPAPLAPYRVSLRSAADDDLLCCIRGCLTQEVCVDESLCLVEWGSALRIAFPSAAATRAFAASLWRGVVLQPCSLASSPAAQLLAAARCCTPPSSPRAKCPKACVTPLPAGSHAVGLKRKAALAEAGCSDGREAPRCRLAVPTPPGFTPLRLGADAAAMPPPLASFAAPSILVTFH